MAAAGLLGGSLVYVQGRETEVRTAPVVQADMTSYIELTGRVRAKREQTVFVPVSGRIGSLSVQVGDRVVQGQRLADLDTREAQNRTLELEAQLGQLDAERAQLQAVPPPEEIGGLEEAVRQADIRSQAALRALNKARNRYDSGEAGREEVIAKEDEWRLAESQLSSARSALLLKQKGPSAEELALNGTKRLEVERQIAALEETVRSGVLEAPIGGTVIRRPAADGQYLPAGGELLTVADLTGVEIAARVKETLMKDIRLGQEAVLRLDALGGGKLAARIVRIDPVATAEQGQDTAAYVNVYLEPAAAAAGLVPGYRVDVDMLDRQAAGALQVPYDALYQDAEGKSFVWRVEGGRAVRVPVLIGMKDEQAFEIREGLHPGESVILNPPAGLEEHQRVRPVAEQGGE